MHRDSPTLLTSVEPQDIDKLLAISSIFVPGYAPAVLQVPDSIPWADEYPDEGGPDDGEPTHKPPRPYEWRLSDAMAVICTHISAYDSLAVSLRHNPIFSHVLF